MAHIRLAHGLAISTLLALPTFAVACGGSSDGSGGAPIPRAEVAARYAAALCDGLPSCCSEAGYTYDRAGCISTLTALLDSTLPAEGEADYDGAAAARCEAEARKTSCKGSGGVITSCRDVFEGRTPIGGPCESSNVCAIPEGAFDVTCRQDGASTTGRCVAEYRRSAGGSCTQTCTETSGATSCSSSGSTSAGDEIGLCYTNDGLVCDPSGQCVPTPGTGDPCVFGGCGPGNYCPSATGQCAEQLPVDAACTSSDSCRDGYCDTTSRVCKPYVALGGACTAFNECGPDARCSNSKCVSSTLASPEICSGDFGDGGS
jgi:hypothetical protein